MIPTFLDPNIAYLLLVGGMVMGMLALVAPGTGLLEIGAVFALVLAGLGIVNLNINLWALIILVIGVFPFILALRRKPFLPFLLVSIATLIVGSVFLFRNTDGSLAVHPLVAGLTSLLAGGILWLVGRKGVEVFGLRPTHSLVSLIGKLGVARTVVHHQGTVYVGGEEWSARSSQPIPQGARVRVVERDGLALIVEAVSPQADTAQ